MNPRSDVIANAVARREPSDGEPPSLPTRTTSPTRRAGNRLAGCRRRLPYAQTAPQTERDRVIARDGSIYDLAVDDRVERPAFSVAGRRCLIDCKNNRRIPVAGSE